MSKRSIKDIGLLVVFIGYLIAYKIVIFPNHMEYAEIANVSFMVLLLASSIQLLGFRKDKKTGLSKNVFKIVFAYLLVTFFVMYGLGFAIGFLKNAYSRNVLTLLDNIFAPILIIIMIELFRYVFIWANKDRKKYIILLTIVLIAFELLIGVGRVDFSDVSELFTLFATILLPVIIKNCVLSYLCYHVGYKVPMFYRLVMDVYIFVVPIIPNLGDYINSMILISVPLLIYISAFGVIDERENKPLPIFNVKNFSISDIPITIILVVFVALISGLFPHYMIGIGSDSMSPKINKGDAVIIKKVNKKTKLEVGDVIAYGKDGKIIIHRVVEVHNNKGDEDTYVTKGDANNGNDPREVKRSNVNGVVKVKIPFIAYPTVWLSENLNFK